MPHHQSIPRLLGLSSSIIVALVASVVVAAPPVAQPNTPPVGGGGPDVFGGYASDHIMIRVKPGIAPYKLKNGAWTLATNAANARAGREVGRNEQRFWHFEDP